MGNTFPVSYTDDQEKDVKILKEMAHQQRISLSKLAMKCILQYLKNNSDSSFSSSKESKDNEDKVLTLLDELYPKASKDWQSHKRREIMSWSLEEQLRWIDDSQEFANILQSRANIIKGRTWEISDLIPSSQKLERIRIERELYLEKHPEKRLGPVSS
jgi:hypothetical protein